MFDGFLKFIRAFLDTWREIEEEKRKREFAEMEQLMEIEKAKSQTADEEVKALSAATKLHRAKADLAEAKSSKGGIFRWV